MYYKLTSRSLRLLAVSVAAVSVLAVAGPAQAANTSYPFAPCAGATLDAANNVYPGGSDVLSPSCFEGGDGNLTADQPAKGRIDWATLKGLTDASGVPLIASETDPTATTPATDNVFDSSNAGAKENDPGSWKLEIQSANVKSDVLAAAVVHDIISSHVFIYSAFQRAAGGDVNFSFELNKGRPNGQLLFNPNNPAADCSATPAPLTCVPYRSEGDLLITYDGNFGAVTVRACRWHGDQFGETSNSSYGWYTLPGYGNVGAQKLQGGTDCTLLPSSLALGNVSNSTQQNLVGGSRILPAFSDSLPAGDFGELAVDVSQVLAQGLAGAAPCFSFGGLWLHTRTSSSGTATMQDYVAPIGLKDAANCAIAVDKKVAVSPGDAATSAPAYPSSSYHDGTAADPSVADRGDALWYALVVTNPAANASGAGISDVSVSDAGCSSLTTSSTVPALKLNDNGDSTLDQVGQDGTNPEQWVWYCKHVVTSGDTEPYSNHVDVAGKIGTKDVTAGDDTDTHVRPQLTVVKHVVDDDGGTASASAFTMSLTGTNLTSSSFAGSEAGTTVSLDPGAYSADETNTGPSGYTESRTDSCDSANSGVGDLAYGDTRTCTITNDDQPASLTIVKHVVNDDGGSAAAGDFTMDVTAGSPSANHFAGSEAGQTITVDAGSYSVDESGGPAGYAESRSASCDGTLAPGGSATCTITNDDVAPTLKIAKTTDPASTGTFDFTAEGTAGAADPAPFGTVTAGVASFTIDGGADTGAQAVKAGSYRITETGPHAGTLGTWVLDDVTCAGATAVDPHPAAGYVDVTLGSGDAASCTFANHRQATLKIAKTTDPASTGTFDFTAQGSGGGDASPFGTVAAGAASFTVDGGSDTGAKALDAGTYQVTEIGPHAGTSGTWVLSGIDCGRAKVTTDLAGGSVQLTLANGDDVTCTFANTKDATVTVHKTEGGRLPLTRTWDFTLAPKGGAAGAPVHPDAVTGDVSFGPVAAGDYTICEINIPSDWETTLGTITAGSACQDVTVVSGQALTVDADNLHPHVTVTKTQADSDLPAGTPGRTATHDPISVHVGDHVAYSVDVHNDGNSTLTFVDPLGETNCDGGTLSGPSSATLAAGLAAGDHWTYTCSYVVSGNESGDAFTNTASAKMHDSTGPLEVTGSDDVSAAVVKPSLTVVKKQKVDGSAASLTHDPIDSHVGDVIDYSITVTNTSNAGTSLDFSASGAIDDPHCDTVAPPAGVDLATDKLASGASWTFTCSHTVTGTEPGDGWSNTFTATGTDRIGGTASGDDTVTAGVLKPGTLLLKAGVDYVHHGDTITYTFKVTNTGNVALHDVYVHDTKCPSDPHFTGTLAVGAQTTLSCDMPVPAHQDGEANPIHNVAQAFGTDTSGTSVGSNESTADARILHPHISVDKKVRVGDGGAFADGPVTAWVGDTLHYQMVVTNDGGDSSVPTPLTVSLTDAQCDSGTLSGPAGVTLGTSVLAGGASWTFTCSHVVAAGDGNAYKNTVSVTGVDQLGGAKGTVSATDEADATIVHPTVTLDKTGPASATAGSLVPFALVVHNTGDDSFAAQLVVVTDPRCEAPPALSSVNGDTSPGTFDPGDGWTYTCAVQTGPTDTTIHNVGFVDATDDGGHHATAQDPADTSLIAVLPETLKVADARLRGPQGCISAKRVSSVTIAGRRIASATFFVDGHKVKTLTRASHGRYTYRLTGKRLRYGSHGVTVKITFRSGSTLRTKTLHMRVNRCRPVVVPAFTG